MASWLVSDKKLFKQSRDKHEDSEVAGSSVSPYRLWPVPKSVAMLLRVP